MKIFAISDPHLSLATPKEMDIFGDNWVDHWTKIKTDWESKVEEDDVVLIAGDISWAMKLEDARCDLEAIGALKGKKLLIKGNHDYWHGSLIKTRSVLPDGMYFLQNDAMKIGDTIFAGTRGWKQPGDQDFIPEDEKIYKRETDRLRLSLSNAAKLGDNIVAMMHYPPFSQRKKATQMTDIFAEYGVKTVVYGHIHGDALKKNIYTDINIDGVEYILTSCDALNFTLKQIYV